MVSVFFKGLHFGKEGSFKKLLTAASKARGLYMNSKSSTDEYVGADKPKMPEN